MPDEYEKFWNLLSQSQLIATDQLTSLRQHYEHGMGPSDQGNANSASAWLVQQNRLSRYQANILLKGQNGPFIYGHYRIHDRIGSGRQAGLFRAVHEPTQHRVLLRFYTSEITANAEAWSHGVHQTRRHCQVEHPNLQQCYELVDVVAYKFLALEELIGPSIDERMGGKRLAYRDACRLMLQASQALFELHRQGLVHGNLCPRNLWTGKSTSLKLLRDPVVDLPAAMTADLITERADYLAPELGVAGSTPSALTDVYALGCTFYELLAGRVPFQGSPPEVLQAHASAPITPLDEKGIPQAIQELVAFMMAKNPSIRYQAAFVIEKLTPIVEQLKPAKASVPSQPATLAAYRDWLAGPHQAPQPPRNAAPPAASATVENLAETVQIRTQPVAQPKPVIRIPEPEIRGPDSPAHREATVTHVAVPPAPQTERPAAPVATVTDGASNATALATRRRLAARRQRQRTLILTGLLGVMLVGVGATLYAFRERIPGLSSLGDATSAGDPNVPTSKSNSENNAAPAAKPDRSDGSGGVADPSGKLLWESPTAGAPITLEYVPPGAQFLLVLRPADLSQTSEGPRVIQALGPQFEDLLAAWNRVTGVPFDEVEQLIVSLHTGESGQIRPAMVLRFSEPRDATQLSSQWQAEQALAGETEYWKSANWAYYIPSQEQGKLLVIAAEPELKDSIDFAGAAPPVRTQIGKLLASSDQTRHVTLIIAPPNVYSELLRDGRSYYFGASRKLREPLRWFLTDDLQAASLSLHFGDQFYWELRGYGQADNDNFALATEFRNRINEIPEQIEAYVARINAPQYWRMIAFRYPSMIRALHDYARVGIDQEQAVVNGRLPEQAAHNLFLGGELVLSSTPGTQTQVAQPDTPRGPSSLEQLLGMPVDLSFDQQSLEFAIADLEASVKGSYRLSFPFAIKIIGQDLERDGITRNQQIANFNGSGLTLEQSLTALVRKANPTSEEDPTSDDQKLVWVVAADPEKPAEQIVLITTRKASATKRFSLPAVFQPTP